LNNDRPRYEPHRPSPTESQDVTTAGQAGAVDQNSSLEAKSFLLTVAYDGSAYCGWQYQPDQLSVQEVLERGLLKVIGHPVRALASSRTDAGVHALGQAVVIRSATWRAPADRLPFALNTYLPPSVVVRQARQIPNTFHPLRNSTGKRYEYVIYNSRKGDPIGGRTHWWVRRPLDLDAMRQAVQFIVGVHDFASFQAAGSPRSSTIRHVRSLQINQRQHLDGQLVTIAVEANGFLYNMVRNIVGTLVQVGVGRESPAWINEVLQLKDRQYAGATAPPQGLFLMEVLFSDANPGDLHA
jgi:tRNA pseudouridine38-40 synthase